MYLSERKPIYVCEFIAIFLNEHTKFDEHNFQWQLWQSPSGTCVKKVGVVHPSSCKCSLKPRNKVNILYSKTKSSIDVGWDLTTKYNKQWIPVEEKYSFRHAIVKNLSCVPYFLLYNTKAVTFTETVIDTQKTGEIRMFAFLSANLYSIYYVLIKFYLF